MALIVHTVWPVGHQERGDMKNARRCYKACIHEGKRGSKVECAAMLR